MDEVCNRMAHQIHLLRTRLADLLKATGIRVRCRMCNVDLYLVPCTIGPVLYDIDGRKHDCGDKRNARPDQRH